MRTDCLMRALSHELVLLPPPFCTCPSRRLRALVRGEDAAFKEWIGGDSSGKSPTRAIRQAKRASACKNRRALVTVRLTAYPAGAARTGRPACVSLRARHVAWAGVRHRRLRTPPAGGLDICARTRGAAPAVVSGLALASMPRRITAHSMRALLPRIRRYRLGRYVSAGAPSLEDEIVSRGGAVASERLPGRTRYEMGAGASRPAASRARAMPRAYCKRNRRRRDADHAFCSDARTAPRFVFDAQGSAEYAGNVQARAAARSRFRIDAFENYCYASGDFILQLASLVNSRRSRSCGRLRFARAFGLGRRRCAVRANAR